jgi:hypothetical protein
MAAKSKKMKAFQTSIANKILKSHFSPMKSNHSLRKTITILIGLIIFTTCRKISTPNPFEKIVFGEWKFIASNAGLSGNFPSSEFEKDNWIEFKETGKYVVHKKWRRIHSEKFKFDQQRSIYNGKYESAIVYEKKISQLFRVRGDTLFLFDQAQEGFSYTFVKR